MNAILFASCLSLLLPMGNSGDRGVDYPPFSAVEAIASVAHSSSSPVSSNRMRDQSSPFMLLEEFMIDTSITYLGAPYFQRDPSVAFDGTNYLVVWQDWRSGSDFDIYGARVDTSGTVLDPSGMAISTATDDQQAPSVAFDGTRYFVVWGDHRSGFDSDIYGARVDTSGTVLDPSGIAISTAANDQGSASVAFDGTNYLVVWGDWRSASDYDIYGARVDTSATVLDPGGVVISTATNDQLVASVAFDGANYLVVWTDARTGSEFDVYGARVDTGATVLDPTGIAISTAGSDQGPPSLTFAGTNHLVVWMDGRNGSDYDIYGARVDTSGTVLDPSGTAICTAANDQWFPSVSFDGTAHLVVWDDWRSGSDTDIYGARVDTSGTVLDTTGIPLSTATDDQQAPSVAFDGTNYFVVWGDYRGGFGSDIYGARVDTSGAVLDPSGLTISTTTNDQLSPSVAFDGMNYLVVWQDSRNSFDYDIYGARVAQSGTVLDPSGIAISAAPYYQWFPSVAFGEANYLVVWDDTRSGFDSDIYGARVDTSGTVLDPSGIAISTAADWQESPSVAFDGTRYLVVWQDARSSSGYDIYGTRVDVSGTVLDPSGISISTATNDQWLPSVVFDGTDYLVVWGDHRNGFDSDIYGARVDTSGTVLDPSGIAIATAADEQYLPSVAFDGTNYFVVWGDYRSGSNSDIYGARVDASGTVLDTSGIPISTATNEQWFSLVAFDGTNYLVVWTDGRGTSDFDIYGARVDTSGTVLDPSGIELINQPHDRMYPAIARGRWGQFLLAYQGFAPEPYNTQRVFGAFQPGVGVEEKPDSESQVVGHGSLNMYPNPVRTLAIVEFFLPKTETVRLCLYNTAGQLAKTILNSELGSGRHRIETSTSELPSGIYFCRLTAGDFTQTRKIVLLK